VGGGLGHRLVDVIDADVGGPRGRLLGGLLRPHAAADAVADEDAGPVEGRDILELPVEDRAVERLGRGHITSREIEMDERVPHGSILRDGAGLWSSPGHGRARRAVRIVLPRNLRKPASCAGTSITIRGAIG
jgi:hypothetical protein